MAQKLTTEEFIKRAKKVHGNKYDYSESIYTVNNEKIKIICPDHGVFLQDAKKHLAGNGCHKCSVARSTSNKSEFIKKAQKLFGNKFDYSKVIYTRAADKVIINCPVHGEFSQTPNKHLTSKYGCSACGQVAVGEAQALSSQDFIAKAKKVHGDTYDYSRVNYVNARKKVIITCKEHGDFEQIPDSHLRGRKCSFCTGKRIGPKNNLEFVFPEIAKEWHPTKNKTKPNQHYSGETKPKRWWICNIGHEYQAPISYRTGKRKTGCPYCAGQKVGKDNNLEFKFPSIAKEWHPIKNGSTKPSDVMPGTDKKYWWLCEKGHEYQATPDKRTGKDKTGCPYCTHQTSSQEMRIMAELHFLDIKILSRYKLEKVEFDVFLPEFNIAIEYDGSYWHRDSEKKDKKKTLFAKTNNINLIRIREKPLFKIEETDICTIDNAKLFKSELNQLMIRIGDFAEILKPKISKYIKHKKFTNEKLFNTYISYSPSPLPEKSLEQLFPEISKEWDYEKNFPLTPKNFSRGSGYKAWWKCSKAGHQWQTSINKRTHSTAGTNCPTCALNQHRDHTNDLGASSLESLHPEIAKEWDYSKNHPYTPKNFSRGSTYRAKWKCSKGHEFEATINSRTRGSGSGCKLCYYESMRKNKSKTYS